MNAPATGAGVVGPQKLSCAVSRCFAVFGDSGSAIEEEAVFDDLESVPHDLAVLLLRVNMSLALLLTELKVPDCGVPLAAGV